MDHLKVMNLTMPADRLYALFLMKVMVDATEWTHCWSERHLMIGTFTFWISCSQYRARSCISWTSEMSSPSIIVTTNRCHVLVSLDQTLRLSECSQPSSHRLARPAVMGGSVYNAPARAFQSI